MQTKKALLQYFSSSSFMRRKCGNKASVPSYMNQINAKDTALLDLFVIPYKNKDDSPRAQSESYDSSLWKFRDQVSFYAPFFSSSYSPRPCLFLLLPFNEFCSILAFGKSKGFASLFQIYNKCTSQVLSMNCPSFTRNVSERDWLKSSAKIWELVKSSPIIAEYSRTLQSSGMFRR